MRLLKQSLLVLMILVGSVGGGALAQGTPDAAAPVLDLLGAVPDLPAETLSIVAFADMDVVELARFGAVDVLTRAKEFEAELDSTGLAWLFSYPQAGLPVASYLMEGIPLYAATLGFEIFDVRQTLYFGQPPSQAFVLQGDFDNAAIIAAHEARGFALQDGYALPVLCGPQGCDGFVIDLERRDMGNLFGGHMGRLEPLALGEGLLLNSPDFERVTALIDVQTAEAASLADNPAYAATARALTQDGLLRQAMFVPETQLPTLADFATFVLGSTASAEQIEALEAELGLSEDRDPAQVLPPYALATWADTVFVEDGTAQATVALAYPDASTADQAAAAMTARLAAFGDWVSLRTGQPLADDLADPQPVVTYDDAETGYSVVLVSWSAPLIEGTAKDENGRTPQSAPLFSLLVDMLYSRDVAWLVAD